MTARFKEPALQRMYETCRRYAADKDSAFWHEGVPSRGAGHRHAYWNGRLGLRASWPKNTFAYAAWAAGQDDLRQYGPIN